jgi:hypothetical protein
MVRPLHVAVALLALLAGCGAVPGGGTPDAPSHTVSVGISNSHDEPYTVRVSTLPSDVEGLVVTYENGSTRRFDVSSFDALPRAGLQNATGVATTDGAGLTETYTVGPGEGIGATFDDAPPNATVVYFVLRDGGREVVRGAGVARCSAETGTTDLDLLVRPDGSLHAAVTCSDDAG